MARRTPNWVSGSATGAQAKWIRAAFKVQKKLKRIYTLGWVHPFDRPDVGITTGLLRANGDPKAGLLRLSCRLSLR